MPSGALQMLSQALVEIEDLERGNPSKFGRKPVDPALTRAIGRASVVLLSSHFERYVHAVNEEATEYINRQQVPAAKFPEQLRLLHTKLPVDELGLCAWENRSTKLTGFVDNDGWLWSSGATTGLLQHARLLLWMKSPKPDSLIRFYKYWEIDDIFRSITNTSHTYQDLRLRLRELVEKRNNIAHGDVTAEATQHDVRLYSKAVWNFCSRADRKLAMRIRDLLQVQRPW
jgi:hypothetical protein